LRLSACGDAMTMRADGCRRVNGRRRTTPAMAHALTRNTQNLRFPHPFSGVAR
jgi:hypothetical protein